MKTLFILGYPRSGTTLLRHILNKNKKIKIIPETSFYPKYYGSRTINYFKKKHIYDIVINGSGDPDMLEYKKYKEDFNSYIQNNNDDFKTILNFFNIQFQTEIIGEKTPLHTFFIKNIIKVFPDAKFICVERNIYNIIASMMISSNIKNYSFKKILAEIFLYRNQIKKISKNKNILFINYKELTHQPKNTIKKICNYLKIDFHENMLYPNFDFTFYNEKKGFTKSKEIKIRKENEKKWKNVINYKQEKLIKKTFNNKLPIQIIPQIILFKLRIFKIQIGLNGIITK